MENEGNCKRARLSDLINAIQAELVTHGFVLQFICKLGWLLPAQKPHGEVRVKKILKMKESIRGKVLRGGCVYLVFVSRMEVS